MISGPEVREQGSKGAILEGLRYELSRVTPAEAAFASGTPSGDDLAERRRGDRLCGRAEAVRSRPR